MAPAGDANFEVPLGCLVAPALNDLAARLAGVSGLRSYERSIFFEASRHALVFCLHKKLCRLLLLELHAARATGRLVKGSSAERWHEFLSLSSRPSFWDSLGEHYPTLPLRIGSIVKNRCSSFVQAAERFALDRQVLDTLTEGSLGRLRAISFGAGDSHRGGQTVAIVQGEGGSVVYKPRSVLVDFELSRFIRGVFAGWSEHAHIRVPRVAVQGEYGWAEWITHAYAKNPEELRCFYRGIGHWLALMRLLGGSDLHAENLIAAGPSSVVVDCETLFTPRPKPPASGLGLATDRASELVGETVLSVGLLPGRGLALAWRGVDDSVLGSLPGQQPMRSVPAIVDEGTDQARLGTKRVPAPVSQNHPSESPALAEYWHEVIAGFTGLTGRLRGLDAKGELDAMLSRFNECTIRVVPRSTQSYMELERMLWHPVSLHDEATAVQRAHTLLAGMSRNLSVAPDDDAVIQAEIADLLEGDVPFFSTLAKEGQLNGPQGVAWLPRENLVASALQKWRNADLALDGQVIKASLVSAYINDGWVPARESLRPHQIHTEDLDTRRRRQAARIMNSIISAKISGEDGSVAWIAPVLRPAGWMVRPITADIYSGLSGLVLLTGAYLREERAGRADPIAGLETLLEGLIISLRLAGEQFEIRSLQPTPARPPVPGGYAGLSSQIWTWLILDEWDTVNDGMERAERIARLLPNAIESDTFHDLMTGSAGAIMPLLMLARASNQHRYMEMAIQIGNRLCEHACIQDGLAHWPHPNWPEGVGGFAHGATGIGWALAKLANATDERRLEKTSAAAMAFEDSLFEPERGGWLDLRRPDETVTQTAWCHGAVGIGLALADLFPSMKDEHIRSRVKSAVASAWRRGVGSNHTLCHGDMGSWELLHWAIPAGLAPPNLTQEAVLAQIISSLEEYGPVWGWAGDAFSPGLLSGVGGIAYQLLRAHPESRLPSVLIPGAGTNEAKTSDKLECAEKECNSLS